MCVATSGSASDRLRLAVYDTELSRKGPGLLLRALDQGGDAQIEAVTKVIVSAHPDILVLLSFDHDHELRALRRFRDTLAGAGATFAYVYSSKPNRGLVTWLDMDGDGQVGQARDAQGFGWFPGQSGIAVLSRFPIEEVRDYSTLLWKDMPGAHLPTRNGHPFPSAQAQGRQRLSTTAHWQVPVRLGNGAVLHLLVFHATPPVFDGPEDRNGLRNADEIGFWRNWLNQAGNTERDGFAILGGFNLDPRDGDGRKASLRALLADPRLVDPMPQSEGAALSGRKQGGTNATHRGNARLDTVDWPDTAGPGNLRVDYILPSSELKVLASGVVWPISANDLGVVEAASRHRLVWVDVAMPAAP